MFRTEDYMKLNIRVNPEQNLSGLEFSQQKNAEGKDSDNEETKHARDAQHDLEKLRAIVRERYERYVERVERELEEAAKAKGK